MLNIIRKCSSMKDIAHVTDLPLTRFTDYPLTTMTARTSWQDGLNAPTAMVTVTVTVTATATSISTPTKATPTKKKKSKKDRCIFGCTGLCFFLQRA